MVGRNIESLQAYYLRQYKKHLKDLRTLINGELNLLETDNQPTCLSALQMTTDNAIVSGQRLTALQEVESEEARS